MIWNIVTAIATLISMFAYIITALYIRAELKSLEKDRYINVTNELFEIWQSREFMTAQLWLLHQLEESTWQEFIEAHRADVGEIAFHRVGSFYDRVGTLARMGLINDKEILATMGGYAIAIWQKLEPLVREARKVENSVLFQDFERLLPACYECYVPLLGQQAQVSPFALTQPVRKITKALLKSRLDRGQPITILDVRHAEQIVSDSRKLPNALLMTPDEVEQHLSELPIDRDIAVYCA